MDDLLNKEWTAWADVGAWANADADTWANTNADVWANADVGAWADVGADNANTQADGAGDKYKDLVNNVWENVISDMIQKQRQIQEVLNDPKQLEWLTKEQIMELYNTEKKLTEQLNEILPVMEERKQQEFTKLTESIQDDSVKAYVNDLIKDLSDAEEVTIVVEMAKKITELVKWSKGNGWGDNKAADPANLKKDVGVDNAGTPVEMGDLKKAMLSPDEEVRKKAMEQFGAALDEAAKGWLE